MDISELINLGDLNEALKAVQQNVRKNPADAKQRVLLFQLQLTRYDIKKLFLFLLIALWEIMF